MADRLTIECRMLPSRQTNEALYVQDPRRATRFVYVPKSEVTYEKSKRGGLWINLDIPEWLAEEKDLR